MDPFVFFAGAVVAGVITAVVAQLRGRSGIGWFALGALFPAVALLVVAVIPPITAESAGPTAETHVRCPDCKELVRKDANVCKHCKCRLVPEGSVIGPESSTATAKTFQPADAQQSSSEMNEYGITFDGQRYRYGEYRYDKYADALAYAKLKR